MKRRLLAFVLVLAMLLSVTPVAVFATDTVVAKIGDTEYGTLSAALNAAADGATIELIWAEGDAPISMAGSVFGNKTVTITGTATVDWSKGWLFVGRGGEGDGKLIFRNANLTAYANSGRDIGIHVSGHEKGEAAKNNGAVEMINSKIELDYLINKGTMVVDNTVLFVHAGFGIAGRPASETEDGKDATATITIKNGSNVTVKNENGMGMGYEGNGVLNLENSSFTCNSAMNVYDEDGSAFNVSGECTLNIKSVNGQSLNLLDGAILKNSTVGGALFANGDITFSCVNKVTTFNPGWYNHVITIGPGASLEITGSDRLTLGYGNTFNITGSIVDAKTADKNAVVPSLKVPAGVSITGGSGATFNVTDAYIVLGSTTSKNSAANGTFALNSTNSIVDITNNLYFAISTNDLTPAFNVNVKDSVLDIATNLGMPNVGCNMTFDNSVVNVHSSLRNGGKLNIKNGSVVTVDAMIQFGENAGNDGTIVVDNSKLNIACSSTGHALDGNGTGKVIIANGGKANVDYVTGTAIEIDGTSTLTTTKLLSSCSVEINAANYIAGTQLLVGDVSDIAGSIEVIGNENVTAVVENGQLVIKAKVAKIGNVTFDTLQDAMDAAEAANTKDIVIDLINNATLDITAWQTLAIGGANTETITINGNGHTLVFNKLNSDWNHVATNNNAKLILSDMTLSDSGYNNGPWNRYDINFACNVELNNVVSNKALAFKADATLNNVTVNESGDNYAIWIQADGQTVVANGLTVNAANGRGIKIDEQYVTDAAKVNLTVTNAEFTTAKKSAILVKTAGGADISVANVDISKVTADPLNIVWVDEDSAANFNDVTVNGGKPAIESANGAIEGLNYVSLGDSMTNGYGLDGYDANNGVEDYGDKSYANQFAAWLAQNNNAVVNHAQLAMSAMRAEDLHWLLEVDYEDPAVIAVIETLQSGNWTRDGHLWNETFTNGDYWTWVELVHDYRFDIAAAYIQHLETAGGVTLNCITNGTDMTKAEKDAIYDHYSDVEALKVVAKYYQESVATADVISLSMGNGNFGVFMFGRIMEAIGFGSTPDEAMIYDVERAIAECPANIQHEILVLKDKLYAEIEKVTGPIAGNPTLEALANTVVYTGLSYVLNYAGSVEAILQRNPDAEIILVALMNTFNDPAQASRAIPGVTDATLGDLLNIVFTPLNAYIAALPTYMQATGNSVYENATFYYAEADRVECLVEVYGDEIQTNTIIRDRFVTDIVGESGDLGMIWKLLSGVQLVEGVALVPVTLEEVCAYDSMSDTEKAAYAAANQREAISIAVYLAFEDAIINAAAGAPVSIASVLNLGSIMSGGMNVFGGVMTEFNKNIGTNGADYIDTAIAVVATGKGVDASVILGLYEAENANVKSAVDMLCMLLALPETLSAAVQNDPSLQGLLGLFARCVIGNGLGAHPSETGHNQLAAAVINAYENGFTAEDQTKENLKVAIPAAYAQAYQYALANGYIDMAKNYIDIASDAVLTADNYVHLLVVPAQLEQTRALLQAELANTLETLAEAKALLNISQLTPETWAQILAMEDQLYIHMATLEDLAAELGVVGNIALDQIGVVVDHYSALVNTIANNAYAWVANGVQEFNAEYAAWVESVGLMADKINPELGAAVRAYLTETPDEALAIMYAAGDDAVVEFIAATAAASDDIKVIITAISAILNSDIADIAAAVKNSAEVAAILAQIDQVKAEIEATVDEMMNHPVSSALAYQQIIDQLKVQLKVLQGQLVDAILNSVDDVDPTLRPLLNKALNALKDAVRVAANYGAEYGAWFDARFDEMLGDLLALLINKTNEFGSIAGPILGEAIDNFLHYVGDLAYERGTELLDKIENEIIPEFIDTLKEYGAQAWAKLVAKLEALGILDAVAQAQKDLNYLYELINSYITDDLADAYDTLLDRMTELKDNVADLIETVGNELANTSEEEIRATLAALQEKLENLYNAILALENVVNEAIHGSINTAIAMAQVALNNVAAAVADLAGVLSEDAAAAVADLVNDVKAMLDEAYVDAITDTYTVTPDSYYVALGDSSVFGENTYAQKLAAELGLTTSQFNNLSTAGMSVAETVGLVNANASAIAKADLITIGYSTNTMMEFVIAQLKAATDNGEAQPMDWTALVGEKLVPHVQKALGDITADMLASGVDAQYAELLAVAVEAYAYAAISHALNYPMVVGSIHEINPDALVVIVGMYNPLAGVSVRLSNTETIEIGDYVQKLIDLANMETLAYAMLAPNTIYVDAPDVTTQAQPGEIPVVNFLMGLLTNGTDKYYATEDGHAYIAQQILNALTVAKIGLLGDANNDGIVNSIDSAMILQYDVNMIEANMIFLAVCDVNGDGSVNSIDAAMILQFDVGMIEQFPAALH